MPEITLNSYPNADIIFIDGVALDQIDAFKAECLSGGSVSCSWDILKGKLEDKTVSKVWWLLNTAERRSIALKAIKNNDYTSSALMVYTGDANCGGATSPAKRGSCALAAAIRFTKLGAPEQIVDYIGLSPTGNSDGCYFQLGNDEPIRCLRQPNPYCLPFYFVQCLNEAADRRHIICAIQIQRPMDSLDNFIMFQYGDVDIKPGDSQMKRDCQVVIHTTNKLGCFGVDSRAPNVTIEATFDI